MLASTLDPDGRRVLLDEEGWDHIKRRRPQLARSMGEIMAAVREPDIRIPGRTENETWFFAELAGTLPWLQVVVHYEGGEGWIVTAFRRAALPRR